MKKTILSLAVVSFVFFTSCKNEKTSEETVVDETVETMVEEPVATAFDYTIETGNSVIDWKGTKPTGEHMGTVALKSGGFMVADNVVTGGEFVIDMNSITVTDLQGDEKAGLEGHLKGTGEEEKADHFFNVNKFPTGEFKIKSVVDGKVTGDLTLKGVTNEVSFPAKIEVNENGVSLVSEAFKIDRTKWGVNYSSKSVFDDLKDKFINDEIELTVKVKAVK
ncbi:YceI family protein [Flavobacterium sp.]|uniref:YceI family protein n=1 Tax=Flavobacterium sp. TaxID=239 RepID=UPI003526FB68